MEINVGPNVVQMIFYGMLNVYDAVPFQHLCHQSIISMSAVSGKNSIAQATTHTFHRIHFDEVACGYLVWPERLVGYAKANAIRHSETFHIDIPKRTMTTVFAMIT